MPFCSVGSNNVVTANFGQTGFMYTPPTGFKAINSKNLKDVGSYNLPDTFGNFVNTPDLVILRSRSAAYEYEVLDTVRGPANYLSLNSNAANSNNWGTLTSFKPNGFDLGSGGYNNAAGAKYASWNWNRGKTPGFDIVTYAGNSTNGTMIPHNLGQVPAWYVTKCLTTNNSANSYADWSVYHKDVDVSSYGGNKTMYLMNNIAAGSAGGFREAKGTSFEGGVRVPCIVRWKGTIQRGQICNKLVSSIDLFPTIADICQVSLPSQKIDGVDILPLLQGKDVTPRRYFYYYYDKNNLKAVRRDDWKLMLPHLSQSYEKYPPGNNGFPGTTIYDFSVPLSLYDLRRDPSERYDVKALYPEIVEELLKIAENAREDLGDDLTNRIGKNVRKVGTEF
jgi:hypothetical protein